MQIFDKVVDLQSFLNSCRKNAQEVSLVPTMGGLHDGHLDLIIRAKKLADINVVSIFVNPTQFSKSEDFDTYPEVIANDIVLLEAKNVDVLFIPSVSEVYPDGMSTDYEVGYLGKILCGISRPSHFNGVAQVVKRLFEIVNPSYAVFGEKDYQQLLIIKSLVSHLDLAVDIHSISTKRDEDGLAKSTRNQYLTKKDRSLAPNLFEQLTKLKILIINDEPIELSRQQAFNNLSNLFQVEYLEVLDANNLKQITTNTKEIIIISAIRLAETRLIDNIVFRRSNV